MDGVILASTPASDLAQLVESMNLADRPSQTHNLNMSSQSARPITARYVSELFGRILFLTC